MKTAPQSLRGLTIAFVCLFLTVTVLAGAGTYFGTLGMIRSLVDKRIHSESDALAPAGAKISATEIKRRIEELGRQRDTGDLGLLLTDAQGRRIAGNARFHRPLPLGYSSLSGRDGIEGLSSGRVLVRELHDGMRLVIFAETEPIDNYFAVRRRIYIAGFGAIILVVFAGLLLFRRLIARRIEEMRETADSIVQGDLSRRVPLNGDGGEFDRQAASFNGMLDRIDLLMTEIRNVSNDISHELRTPLARLRNELALLEQRPEAAPIADALSLAKAQADDLLAMFSALLRIAAIESGPRNAAFVSLRLDLLAEEVAQIVRPLADETGHRVTVRSDGAIEYAGDRQLLAQMLLNLVENSVRHTPPHTAISIAVAQRPEGALLIVEDNGPGIAEAHRDLALRRFGRLDPSRTRSGHGLGLPLAGAIARLHHGTLELQDAAPGLRVVVRLPR